VNTSSWNNMALRFPTYQSRVSNRSNAYRNPANPCTMKAHFFFHDLLQKKTHLSLSHALLISNLRAMCPTFPVFFIFIWWRVSKATRMLFEISLSHWKALCDSKMIWGKILFNLLANTLETSLYKILHSAIGQNS